MLVERFSEAYCLPYTRLPKKNHALMMATAIADTFDNYQHSTRLIPESPKSLHEIKYSLCI
jgi:hypothetical protein